MADTPQYFPSPRELDDLELLRDGALDPLDGFESAGGSVTLAVPAELAGADVLELVDQENTPLALVRVDATYPAGELVGVAGPVTPYERAAPEGQPARAGRLTSATLTVPVSAPLTMPDLHAIECAARGSSVLLLALAGHERPVGCSGSGLVRATRAAARLLPDARVEVVPLARRNDALADERLRERVIAAYAPGEIFECTGEGPLPDPVVDVLGGERSGGVVVFFTGLSGSGKSTLARALHEAITANGRAVTRLDGDVVRRNLSAGLTFSKQDRETNIRRIAWVAAEIGKHGGFAICSPIAPFDAGRRQARAMAEQAGGTFVLVHVATPLAECERRDRKGLYAKARRGEIDEFTGISSPYESPRDADIRIDTTRCGVRDAVAELLRLLDERTQAGARFAAIPVDETVGADEPASGDGGTR